MNAELPVSGFRVDAEACTGCGLCAADCPAGIIAVNDGVAAMKPADDGECIGCQHCLAVCPVAAVSVAGKSPSASRPTGRVDAAAMETAILARRSVRKFTGPVDDETLRRVLDIVNHAPTAVNRREIHFTVVSGAEAMADLRRRSCEALVAGRELIEEGRRWIADVAQEWLDGGADGIFREAPNLIVASAGPGQIHTGVDCVIALSYFDLCASANGIGTTWCGMFDTVLRAVPQARTWLGIPDDDGIGYAMLFGMSGVRYARSAQYAPASATILKGLL